MERVHGEREAKSITATSSGPWCASQEPLPVTVSGSSCFQPCNSGWPTMGCGNGVVNGPMWSMCASCTWRRPPWRPRWTRPFPASGNGRALRLRGGAGVGRAQGARSAGADPVREAGPESLRPAADGQPGHGGGVRMMDTSVMQERIGQLCHQFKLSHHGDPVGGSFHRGRPCTCPRLLRVAGG